MDTRREFIISCGLDQRLAIAADYAKAKWGDVLDLDLETEVLEGISALVADYASIGLEQARMIVRALAGIGEG